MQVAPSPPFPPCGIVPAMALITHPVTNLSVGDPELVPLELKKLPTPGLLAEAASSLILSASGWRKVFASPLPGDPRASWAAPLAPGKVDEDSLSAQVSPTDLVLAGAMALAFGDWIVQRSGRRDAAILLGIDSRPTGPTLADIMVRVWLARGLRPRYLSIVAAPEVMAYSRQVTGLPPDNAERAEGFCYISASHNPPAHNGVKFGTGGGVLPGSEAKELIATYRTLLADPELGKRIFLLVDEAEADSVASVFTDVRNWKRRAVSAYTLFAREVASGSAEHATQEALFDAMEAGARARPLGVMADFNGSARSLSIDEDFLSGIGVKFAGLNATPGGFAHRIVPEGASLDTARKALEAAYAADPDYLVGYLPDCDGDRGNLVHFDGRAGFARVIEAQEVFAVAVLGELALLARSGAFALPGARVAVAVNDGTSLRIEAIASVFGAEVLRCETGEANVVGLASALRAGGAIVRILGEGSNGGNITHPSEVRDPLSTLGSVLKLLLLRDTDGQEGLFRLWLRLSKQEDRYREDFDLGDILDSLPRFATTSVFEERAALRIATSDHAALKAAYQPLFVAGWEKRRPEFEKRFGIVAFEALASQGTGESSVGLDFAASGQGGLRLLFKDSAGKPKGFLWMRGSGTEPVFRIMADIEGGRGMDEEWLLGWQTELVRAADAEAQAR